VSTGRVNISYRVGGAVVDAQIDREDEQGAATLVPLPAGIAGTLTTRTDADTGIVTVLAGHGITTSDTVTLFWAGGVRRGLTVTATAATTISIDVGAGADLPAVSSVVTIAKEVVTSLGHIGNDLAIFAIHSVNRLMANIRDATPATILALDIAGRESFAYISTFSGTNPFAGETLVTAVLANGGTTAATATILHLKNTIV
jgi:hypothetical protein